MEHSRTKEIIDALSSKDQDKLKRLEVTNEEIESILKSINNKIEKLDYEILQYIINVEKQVNYNFVEDYKNYLLNHTVLKPEKNILELSNGVEKLVRYFYSMDPNSKTYILKFQSLDSEFKNKLVPFGELEFGDTLCFERETNKIVVYNHENDTIDLIANDWNGFMAKLYDGFNSKKKNNILECPKCDGMLAFLMPDGKTLYCNKCEKYYKNDNGSVGVETTSPYQRKDILY